MESRIDVIRKDEINRLVRQLEIEKNLAKKLNISSVRLGNVVVRNEQNWIINEKVIEYCWMVNVTISFVGWFHWFYPYFF